MFARLLGCGTERWHLVATADHGLEQGPLVGQRQPSTAITTEYASADPIFQAKTAVSEDDQTGQREIPPLTSRLRLYHRSTLTTALSEVMDDADGEVRPNERC